MTVKDTRVPLRPDLVGTVAAAREALAVAAFDRERVRLDLLQAAKAGLTFCLIRVPQPVDLRATAAAEILSSWLAGEAIEHRWERRGDTGDAASYGGPCYDLLVSWGDKALAGIS